MKVQLTPALAKLVQKKMRTGYYVNESEVVCEALRIAVHLDDWHCLEIKKHKERSGNELGRADRGLRTGNKRNGVRSRATVKGGRKAAKNPR